MPETDSHRPDWVRTLAHWEATPQWPNPPQNKPFGHRGCLPQHPGGIGHTDGRFVFRRRVISADLVGTFSGSEM